MIKKSNEITLGDAINDLLDVYRLRPKINEVKLRNFWENNLGKTISKHTTKLTLKNKTLYVELDSAALKHELMFARTKLIQRLNEAIGEKAVEEIVFK